MELFRIKNDVTLFGVNGIKGVHKPKGRFFWFVARQRFDRVKIKRVHNIVVFTTKLWTKYASLKDKD